ncbi:hypothetical protein [uncultured Amnibacterium sp.]|uniref:hypothetical protein n=1 Tax=uncultured Amnibacterium sp. TaxID=1631851 RepID=UPI0035C95BF8
MQRGRTGVVVAALGLLLAVTGIAAPAQAASDKHLRVKTVATSAHYLVYRQKLATGYSISFPANSTLYFLGEDLKRHPLKGFDPRGDIRIADDTVVAQLSSEGSDPADPTGGTQLHWRNLRTGDEGNSTVAATDTYANPALHGWIVKRNTGATAANGQPIYRLLTISTAGVVRDYGIPYPNGASFRVVAGPKGLLTSPAVYSGEGDDDSPIGDGRVRYSLYANYGSWTTVYNAHADVDFSCGRPSTTHAGCGFEEAVDGRHDGYALLSLKSGKLTWLVDHPKHCLFSARDAFKNTLVGEATSTSPKQHCVRGRLTALAADGRIENSKHRWGAHSPSTVGLGRILVSNNDQRGIYGLTSVNAKPKLLVQAR